jgi:hypothetical protein
MGSTGRGESLGVKLGWRLMSSKSKVVWYELAADFDAVHAALNSALVSGMIMSRAGDGRLCRSAQDMPISVSISDAEAFEAP